MDFKCPHRVLVEGGHENHGGQWWRELRERLKAVELRHLDVEEEQIGALTIHGGDGLATVGAFADDFDAGLGRQERAEAFAGERFVVDDEGGEFHPEEWNANLR